MESISLTKAKSPAHAGSNRLGLVLAGLGLSAGCGMIVASVFNVESYMLLIQEDGVLENGSATLWLLAAMAAAWGFSRNHSNAKRITVMGLILFFVFCGGEEISWGQRLLGFHGPQQLLDINKQQETNLHNIGSISVFSNVFFLLTIAFFIGIPTLANTSQRWSRLQKLQSLLPVVSADTKRVYLISFCMWLFVGLRFGTLGFHPISLWGHYTQADDEFFEFFMAYSFFAFSVLDLFCRTHSEPNRELRNNLPELSRYNQPLPANKPS